MNPEIDLKDMRQRLEHRRLELTWQRESELAQAQEPPGDGGHDAGDESVRDNQRSYHHQRMESALDEMRDIDAALARIEDGTYGTCIRCEEEIDVARLRALPATRWCVSCAEQRATERRETVPHTL